MLVFCDCFPPRGGRIPLQKSHLLLHVPWQIEPILALFLRNRILLHTSSSCAPPSGAHSPSLGPDLASVWGQLPLFPSDLMRMCLLQGFFRFSIDRSFPFTIPRLSIPCLPSSYSVVALMLMLSVIRPPFHPCAVFYVSFYVPFTFSCAPSFALSCALSIPF